MRAAVSTSLALLTIALTSCGGGGEGPTAPTIQAGPPARLEVISGDAQVAVVGKELPDPLVVRVVDDASRPIKGQIVNFKVVSGGGSVFAGAAITDADGQARERWTLGTSTLQSQRVEARAVDTQTGAKQVFNVFSATPQADTPAQLTKGTGDAQQAVAGNPLRDSLAVLVQDRYGNPVPNTATTWAVTTGGGVLAAPVVRTNAEGVARNAWRMGTILGAAAVSVAIEGSSVPAVGFAATAKSPVTSVTITPPTAALYVGQSAVFTAAAKDSVAAALPGYSFNWLTSDPLVATISATGQVTANKVGRVTITATTDGVQGTAQLTVALVPVARVSLTPRVVDLFESKTQQLAVQLLDSTNAPLDARPVTWVSRDPATASVSSIGLVTALAVGTTRVVATSEGVSDSASITVARMPVAEVIVSPSTLTLYYLTGGQLTAILKSASGEVLTGRTVTWTISDEQVAYLPAPGYSGGTSAGYVVGRIEGQATVTATSEGTTGTASMTVLASPVTSIAVAPTAVTVAVGQSAQLSASLTDDGSHGPMGHRIVWTSSDESVATVTSLGLETRTYTMGLNATVTAIKPGTALITATSGGKAASVQVNVPGAGPDLTPPSIDALTVSPLAVDVTSAGQMVTATARITDAGRGVIGFDFMVNAPGGGLQHGCQTRTLASGTAANGIWTCAATIPLGSVPGDWTFTMNAYDAAQNMQGLHTAADLSSRGFPTKVSVTSASPDVTPPSIDALTVTPLSVDVTGGAQTVTASARISDAGRGVIGFDFLLNAPGSSGIQTSCQTRTLASGTAADGTWSCVATVPLGTRPGDWTIAVNAYDAAQNFFGLHDSTALSGRGFPTKVSVASANPDLTPPSIDALTVTPLSVNVTSGAQSVTATARITDGGRGVIGFDFILNAPGSAGIQSMCQTRTLASGTSADGTWTCTATIPLGSRPGDWTIALNAYDAAKNHLPLHTAADLAARGFATKVTVISQ